MTDVHRPEPKHCFRREVHTDHEYMWFEGDDRVWRPCPGTKGTPAENTLVTLFATDPSFGALRGHGRDHLRAAALDELRGRDGAVADAVRRWIKPQFAAAYTDRLLRLVANARRAGDPHGETPVDIEAGTSGQAS